MLRFDHLLFESELKCQSLKSLKCCDRFCWFKFCSLILVILSLEEWGTKICWKQKPASFSADSGCCEQKSFFGRRRKVESFSVSMHRLNVKCFPLVYSLSLTSWMVAQQVQTLLKCCFQCSNSTLKSVFVKWFPVFIYNRNWYKFRSGIDISTLL